RPRRSGKSSMKYLIPPILLLLTAGAVYSTYLLFPAEFEDCCEWVGLIAPEGVSEVPGVAHADLADALEDGSIPQDLPGLKLGDAPGEITLTGLDDRQVTVDFSRAELTAIVWVSMKCPTSLVYEERLNELEQEFPHVQWVAINSSAREGMAD